MLYKNLGVPSCLLLEFEFSLVYIDFTYLIEFLSPLKVIKNMFVLPACNWILPSNVKINKQLQLSSISKMEAEIFSRHRSTLRTITIPSQILDTQDDRNPNDNHRRYHQ